MPESLRSVGRATAAALMIGIAAPPLLAQRPELKVEPWISVEGVYDNNPFLLTSSRKRSVGDPSAADLASGRFAGMERAEDFVVEARAGAAVVTPGLGGRDLTLSPALRYELYTSNTDRSHLTASVGLSQALRRGMRTRIEVAYTPSYFPKNYLADATDANGDGSISDDERRYAPGEYSSTEVELAHRLRLRRSARGSPLEVHLDLGAGYRTRGYDAPFEGRDLRGPSFRSTLDVEPGRNVDFTIEYVLETLSADVGEEVLILNETEAGTDLNGNGSSTDLAVRTVQPVDRSRREHEVTLAAHFDVARRTDLRIGYGLRFRNYSSQQSLDLGHRDRRDTRHELRGELVRRLARGLRLTTGARYARQTTNRLFDPDQTDEADDYSRIRGYAGLRLEF